MEKFYELLFFLALAGLAKYLDYRTKNLPVKAQSPPPRGRYVNHWQEHLFNLFRKHIESQNQQTNSSFFPNGDLAVLFGICGLLIFCLVLDVQGRSSAEVFVRPLAFSLFVYPVTRVLWFMSGLRTPKPASVQEKPTPSIVLKRLGKYDCLEKVGAGAFGTVYRAVDPSNPDVTWAVKEMHVASGSQLETLRQSFDREQKVLSWLDHPGIVARKEFFSEGNSLVLVMEFVHGLSLRQFLQPRSEPFSIHVVLPIVESVCSALVHLHSQKPQPIVFRDLKPANILVDPLGNVKLVDFGICRVANSASTSLPQIQAAGPDATEVLGKRGDTLCLGTPGYAAPEQYPESQTESDPRADVYALGVVMWEMLSGQSPPKKPGPLPSLKAYQPGLPSEVQTIIDRATSLNRDKRYSSSRIMLSALQEAVSKLVDDDKGFEEFLAALEQGFQSQKRESLLPDSGIRQALTRTL
ncbi:serine/threonine protein kinase [bacterium]|nr:serine/threonine protein kinase [bacterium]